MIPVASNNHIAVIHLQHLSQRTLLVKTTEALETMVGRVVILYREGLADAQALLVATRYEHFARLQDNTETVVVFVCSLHQVPFAVFQILGSGGWHEACGVTANENHLAIRKESTMAATRDIKVGQAHRINLLLRTCSRWQLLRHHGQNSHEEEEKQHAFQEQQPSLMQEI